MQRILILLLLQVVTLSVLAVPARPGRRLVTLPDGTTREVLLRGDERCHWLTDLQGYEIRDTRIVSNRLLQHVDAPAALTAQTSTAPRTKAPAKAGELLLEGSFPTRGKHRLLALLINYANTTPTYSCEQFDAMLNGEGYGGVGSFRDYFLDQSDGQLDIHTTVTPWITVSQPKQYYNIDNTPSLIAEALRQIDDTVDFRDYDNDHDGILDGLIVIHAGQGQEASGDITDIWSHSSTIYGMQFDGVSVYRYTIEPEQLHNGPSTIGVFCHEFGHNLGALDYYDTNYSSDGSYSGTGPWDIMGEGAWNGDGGTGTRPAPFTAWQKWQFGWIEPEILDTTAYVRLPTGTARRFDTTTEGDYFILENIQPTTPWTIDIPGHGLIVTHVIESVFRQRMGMNNINSTYPQGIYTVCADAHSDPLSNQPSSYGDLTSSATPFPGTRGHDTFTDETLPSTHSQDGRYSYAGLHHIAETEATITFDYIQGDAPQRPQQLTATVSRGVVSLSWTFAADALLPVRCTVYRDGIQLAHVDAPATGIAYTYTDTRGDAQGLVTYTVDATYPDGLISAVSSVSTRIPQQLASDFAISILDATEAIDAIDNPDAIDANDGPMLRLSWSLPTELTRCTDNLQYDLVDHYATTFSYAHRFRADDLLPHIGQQIRSISFIPQQRSTDASYTITVWRTPSVRGAEPSTTLPVSALEVVAQRAVSEFSPTYQRSVPFVTRPTIEAGYDYFIGVEITSKNGLAEAVTDQSELQRGNGNLMSVNGGAWQTDPLARGNYILKATLSGAPSGDAVQSVHYDAHAYVEDAATPSLFLDTYSPFDVDADLIFPLGFTIYNEGRRVLETTSSVGATLPVRHLLVGSDGTLTLSLVSSYKNINESRPLDAAIVLSGNTDGLESVATASPASSVCYDLQGRSVYPTARGLYIVQGKKVVKR